MFSISWSKQVYLTGLGKERIEGGAQTSESRHSLNTGNNRPFLPFNQFVQKRQHPITLYSEFKGRMKGKSTELLTNTAPKGLPTETPPICAKYVIETEFYTLSC